MSIVFQVEDIEWPFDKQRNARRNFAFIVFEEEDAADRASAYPKQMFGEREVGFSFVYCQFCKPIIW